MLEFYQPDTMSPVHVEVYGKWFAVVAMFNTLEETNTYLELHPECGLIKEAGIVCIIADNEDKGKLNI